MTVKMDSAPSKPVTPGRYLKTAAWFYFAALAVVSSSCMWEIFYGTGFSHPIWDKNFNWLPLGVQLLGASLAGAALFTFAGPINDRLAKFNGRLKAAGLPKMAAGRAGRPART